MAKVVLRNNESQQQLLKRFRKTVIRSGVLSEVRKRRWFVSRNAKRRMEKKKSIRRYNQRLKRMRQ